MPGTLIDFETPVDEGIKRAVLIFRKAGVETFESCEGGEGHAYTEPTIAFYGERSEGFRALAVAMENNLPIDSIRRVWHFIDGEPSGPRWEIVFPRKLD